jgi:hypothetical protein
MLVTQKKIMESTKASSGLIKRFWGSGKVDVVSITEVWQKLAKAPAMKKYKNLVDEMSYLKKKEENK